MVSGDLGINGYNAQSLASQVEFSFVVEPVTGQNRSLEERIVSRPARTAELATPTRSVQSMAGGASGARGHLVASSADLAKWQEEDDAINQRQHLEERIARDLTQMA